MNAANTQILEITDSPRQTTRTLIWEGCFYLK